MFCLAHLVRDIKFLTTLPDEGDKRFGKALLTDFKWLFHTLTSSRQNPKGQVRKGYVQNQKPDIDRRITQGSRSVMGRQRKARIWTVLTTCQKQGWSSWQFLQNTLSAYYFQTPTPSLLPQAS